MSAFATLDELQDRLDWTLSAQESTVAEAALDDASEYAKQYGKDTWTRASAPRLVRVIVLRAVTRYMKNFNAYSQSRAGDETVAWDGRDVRSDEAGSFQFSQEEKELLAGLAGRGQVLVSVPLSAHGPQRKPLSEGYVPAPLGKKFPMFSSDTSPW